MVSLMFAASLCWANGDNALCAPMRQGLVDREYDSVIAICIAQPKCLQKGHTLARCFHECHQSNNHPSRVLCVTTEPIIAVAFKF